MIPDGESETTRPAADPPPEGGRFTGMDRSHHNRRSVKLADVLSRAIITVGGFGTIIAVLLVCVFLFAVAGDLFRPASVGAVERHDEPLPAEATTVATGTDEYRLITWILTSDGLIRARNLGGGHLLYERRLFTEHPTCWSVLPSRVTQRQDGIIVGGLEETFAAGFPDGSVRTVTVRFTTRLHPEDAVALFLGERKVWTWKEHPEAPGLIGVAELTPIGQVRHQVVEAQVDEPVPLGGRPLQCLTHLRTVDEERGREELRLAAVDEDGLIHVVRRRRRLGMEQWGTRQGSAQVQESRGAPAGLMFTDRSEQLHLVWADGRAERFAVADPQEIHPVERVDLLPDNEATVTALGLLVGHSTLLVGDSTGGIGCWFRARPEQGDETTTADGWQYIRGHTIHTAADVAITHFATSFRSRFFVAADAAGSIRCYNATTEQELLTIADAGAVDALAIDPKEDGITAASGTAVHNWAVDPSHHEVSLGVLFLPVHYEGYTEPRQMWQSGGGDDSSEPKLSLWVLICGTLKATLYSVLFGVPVALFAALYTAEFMHPKARNIVKPTLEFMASLPSVILGFIAALIIAGWVEDHLCAIFVGMILVPIALLGGAQLWLLIPSRLSRRWPLLRLPGIAIAILGAVALAFVLGDLCERWFFTVDVLKEGQVTRFTGLIRWLNMREGQSSPFGGWLFLFLPITALTVGLGATFLVKPVLRRVSPGWSERRTAVASLVNFLVQVLLAVGLATFLAWLAGLVADPRDFIIGRFAQRNALVVGFVMGFAIIPIIFTIADDALTSVPQTLRSASLGAGATPWQTAIRVVIPAAMSGIFSAVMIGVGRAVGETMIVLMAAGNVPLTEFNLLNGMRTLSANIATEIPEAVRGSSHYRLLFFSGLILFAMTFVLNTVSEVIRMRFRAKSKQL